MKPRSDAVLQNLPLEDQETLKEWLCTRSYSDVVKLLAADPPEGMAVRVKETSVRRYYQVMPDYLAECRKSSIGTARRLNSELAVEPNSFDLPTIDALKQRVFEMSVNPGSNPDALSKLYRLILRANDQKLNREKFETDVTEMIIRNFDKISAAMPKKKRDPKTMRIARDKIRLHVFGCLTDAEEPLTGRDYPNCSSQRRKPADVIVTRPVNETADIASTERNESASRNGDVTGLLTSTATSEDEEEKLSFEEMVEQAADGMELPEPERKWGPWGPPISLEAFKEKYPDRPYDPYPEIEEGNAVIMEPEKPFQDPNPIPPLYFEKEDGRSCKCRSGQDGYGSYCTFDYEDGFNPHGVNTKYVMNHTVGKYMRRDEQ